MGPQWSRGTPPEPWPCGWWCFLVRKKWWAVSGSALTCLHIIHLMEIQFWTLFGNKLCCHRFFEKATPSFTFLFLLGCEIISLARSLPLLWWNSLTILVRWRLCIFPSILTILTRFSCDHVSATSDFINKTCYKISQKRGLFKSWRPSRVNHTVDCLQISILPLLASWCIF